MPTNATLAKKALTSMFPKVSVSTGRGSAYGWVSVSIEVTKPSNCFCKLPIQWPEDYCENCRIQERIATSRAREQLLRVPFSKYDDDMGDTHRRYSINVSVN